MFKTRLGLFLITTMNSFEGHSQTNADSIDYWIGNISPRCALKIIYYDFTMNNFIFNSTHDIPVMLVPIKYYHTWEPIVRYLRTHKFRNSSLRFLKAECYFSLIYYKLPEDFSNKLTQDFGSLDTSNSIWFSLL